jgi:hypothetical protein
MVLVAVGWGFGAERVRNCGVYVWILCMHTSIASSEFEIFSHVVTQRI